MKKKLKKLFKSLTFIEWIEFVILFVLVIFGLALIFKFLFIGEPKTYETPAGSYTCTGGLIKACSGSKEVADYLGV